MPVSGVWLVVNEWTVTVEPVGESDIPGCLVYPVLNVLHSDIPGCVAYPVLHVLHSDMPGCLAYPVLNILHSAKKKSTVNI